MLAGRQVLWGVWRLRRRVALLGLLRRFCLLHAWSRRRPRANGGLWLEGVDKAPA